MSVDLVANICAKVEEAGRWMAHSLRPSQGQPSTKQRRGFRLAILLLKRGTHFGGSSGEAAAMLASSLVVWRQRRSVVLREESFRLRIVQATGNM